VKKLVKTRYQISSVPFVRKHIIASAFQKVRAKVGEEPSSDGHAAGIIASVAEKVSLLVEVCS